MSWTYISRIDAAIDAAPTSVKGECLVAEKASYLARLGQVEAARELLAGVQARNLNQPHPHIAAWSKFADGMLVHFTNMGAAAGDNLKRAKALAIASGETRLAPLACGWLAYLAFTRLDTASLVAELNDAITLAAEDNYSARARSSLVLAQAFDFVVGIHEASPWYRYSQRMASLEGDEAMLSAIMHNKAWLAVANRRFYELAGIGEPGADDWIQLSAASIQNFDSGIGLQSLDTLVPLLRAQVLLLLGNFAEAATLLEEEISPSISQGLGRLESTFIADLAYCYAKLGRYVDARSTMELALSAPSENIQIDDRATTNSRLGQVCALIGDEVSSAKFAASARELWLEFERFRNNFAAELRNLPRPDLVAKAN